MRREEKWGCGWVGECRHLLRGAVSLGGPTSYSLLQFERCFLSVLSPVKLRGRATELSILYPNTVPGTQLEGGSDKNCPSLLWVPHQLLYM